MSITRFGRRGMLLAGAVLALTVGCKDSNSPHTPGTVSAVAGDNQVGAAGNAASPSLRVQVDGEDGSPVSGVTVSWTILSGDGTLSANESSTDKDGYASVDFTAGTDPSTTTVQAKAGSVTTIFKLFVAGE